MSVLGTGQAHGKVILLGEHSVVYGHAALAMPIEPMLQVELSSSDRGPRLIAECWDLDVDVNAPTAQHERVAKAVLQALQVFPSLGQDIQVHVYSQIPPSAGLGSSAALALALLRACAQATEQSLPMPEILKQAMEIERCFHGNPSGLDHSVIAMQKLVLFQQGAVLRSDLSVKDSLHFVIGVIGQHAPTAINVQRLAQRRQRLEYTYQRCFEHIGSLVLEAVAALESGDAQALGALLDLNHGALNGLGVSSVDLERAVSCAREAGAIGAKLSGAGGGGAMIALCPKQGIDDVSQALTSMGCQTFSSTLHAN